MEYQTLYRAWRPKRFSDIVGQDAIVTTLTNQIASGRIAHAYLFCGSRGTGKTSTAKVFSRAINCLSPVNGFEPCGECEACRQILSETSMDVIEIDAASNNGVDEIRDLRDKVAYPPSVGKYKVYIIDEVHMLSTGAFNALLKTLEEPPRHAVFLLATTEPQKLPATILSRCQRYDFKRFSSMVIVNRLKEALPGSGKQVTEGALFDIARSSEGGMRDAWNLLEMCLAYDDGRDTVDEALVTQVLGASDRSFLFRFAQSLIDDNAAEALTMVSEAMRDGRDAAVFARETASHMRALLLAQAVDEGLAELLDCTREDAQRYHEQSALASFEKLRRAMDLFIAADSDMRYAAQPRSVLELTCVKACHPEKEKSIEALEQRIAQLEKALAEGATVAAKPAKKPAEKATAEKAPEAKKPAPAKAAPASGQEGWDKAMADIQSNEKSLYALISHAVYKGMQGDAVQIELPKKFKVYLGILQTDSKKTLLEQKLSEAYGKPVHAQIALEGEAKQAVSRDGLSELYDVFDRENVSVED